MKTNRLPRSVQCLCLAALGVAPLLPLAHGQAAPAASDAAVLAKYDKNKNGRLDSDELAALQSDQAKAGKTPVETTSATTDNVVVELSPFEVNSAQDRGYMAT